MKSLFKAGLACALIFAPSFNQALAAEANSLVIDIHVDGNDSYQFVSQSLARGSKTDSKITLLLKANSDGKSLEQKFTIPAPAQPNEASLEILSNNEIRLVDPKNKIDSTAAAKVERVSWFNRDVESLTIPSAELEKILGESLKNMGDQLITQFSASSQDSNISYSLQLSDYSCAAANAQLNCKMNATLHFEISRQ